MMGSQAGNANASNPGTVSTGTNRSTTQNTTPSTTQQPNNMGQAVSAAAHQAKADAKAAGIQVGPAVSAAVHEAQLAARDREAEDEDRETGLISSNTTTGNVTPGTGSTPTSDASTRR